MPRGSEHRMRQVVALLFVTCTTGQLQRETFEGEVGRALPKIVKWIPWLSSEAHVARSIAQHVMEANRRVQSIFSKLHILQRLGPVQPTGQPTETEQRNDYHSRLLPFRRLLLQQVAPCIVRKWHQQARASFPTQPQLSLAHLICHDSLLGNAWWKSCAPETPVPWHRVTLNEV